MGEPDDLSRPLALGRALNFAAGASTAMCNAMLSEHGLTLPQWVVLSALWRRDYLTVGEIAAYSGNNIPATSRILDRMIERQFVRRESDPKDKRTVRVALCPAGEELRHLMTFYETVNARLLTGFSGDEAAQLYDLLARVERNAQMSETG